jgi:hypothetical protein
VRTETRYILMATVILLIIGGILYFLPGDAASIDSAFRKLKMATGYTLLALVFLYGFAVLVYIANGRIDLSGLLSETDGKGASMSRFQLLIFTMVIALSLFMVVAATMEFPKSIPPEVLTLLGISASTYAVSKGIQMSGVASDDDANTASITKTETTRVTAKLPPDEGDGK